jgi:transposase
MLNAANIRGPKFDGASGQKWLLTHGHLLKDVQRDAFANFLDIIMLIERQRECLRRKIIFANRRQDFSARITMLKSVPGIDEIWACIIAAEVGPFERFPNADTLEFWAGMTADNLIQANSIINNNLTDKGRIKSHRQFALPVR